MFLLVPAYPGCPGSKAVKRSSSILETVHRRGLHSAPFDPATSNFVDELRRISTPSKSSTDQSRRRRVLAAPSHFENLYSPKIHGRYRRDTDMYKRQKKNNNTQYTVYRHSFSTQSRKNTAYLNDVLFLHSLQRSTPCTSSELLQLLSPRKLSRRIMESPAYVCLFVCLSVCLSVTTITK